MEEGGGEGGGRGREGEESVVERGEREVYIWLSKYLGTVIRLNIDLTTLYLS